MTVIFAALIFSPAIISVAYSLRAVILWILSMRGASARKELLIGALGPFSMLFPGLMGEQSKKYFSQFVAGICFFIVYIGALLLLFGK